jgi:hypothetical protein
MLMICEALYKILYFFMLHYYLLDIIAIIADNKTT